jgi:signal transduction histidine kinase
VITVGDKSIRALLIEDNIADSRLIREMLSESKEVSFDLKYVERLQAGLEQLGQGGIDVVLLDLGLPDSQGLETLDKTYALAPEVPIVVLTGLDDDTLGVKAVNRGAQDYLKKGQVDGELLMRTIRYAIERKRAKERESELQRQLDLSRRLVSVGVMTTGVAHEVNNPLAKIIGFTELLMQKGISEEVREEVRAINENAHQVAEIVQNLLTFAQEQELERKYVDINGLIESTLAMRAHTLETNNIRITTQLDPELPRVLADGAQLQQVFLNLIVNSGAAMKAAHGEGNLLIKTEVIDKAVQITFADDGTGITEENLWYLFVPFFTTRGLGKGTGLGLSICYGIISQHGGRIYAKSELGKGATFFVELPIAAGERQPDSAKVPDAEIQ